MKLPEGLHADQHKGFEGDSLLHRMLPSVFYLKGVLPLVVQGEKQIMLRIMWEALKRLVRRVLRRP